MADRKVFDVKFDFSMSKSPWGQVLSRFRRIGDGFIRGRFFKKSFFLKSVHGVTGVKPFEKRSQGIFKRKKHIGQRKGGLATGASRRLSLAKIGRFGIQISLPPHPHSALMQTFLAKNPENFGRGPKN